MRGVGRLGGGGWDTEPVLVFKGPDPEYPAAAIRRNVSGEVILAIRVLVDGSTEVTGVLKSLPHCVGVAKESARRYRWRPALKGGRPVEATGVITVRFQLLR